MTALRFLLLDVFTDRALTGNQLAVTPGCPGVAILKGGWCRPLSVYGVAVGYAI